MEKRASRSQSSILLAQRLCPASLLAQAASAIVGSDIAERVDASAVDRRVQIHHALGVEGRDAVEVEAIERSHHKCGANQHKLFI